MPPIKNLVRTAAVAAVLLSSTSTGAVPTTIYLRAFVPVYCNVELVPAANTADEEGLVNLGTSQELCNSPNGYRIILQHPADLVDVALISDASRIPLSPSGETVVWNSSQPGFEQRHLALDLGDGPTSIERLGLRIEVNY
jgi:hypothetical protein